MQLKKINENENYNDINNSINKIINKIVPFHPEWTFNFENWELHIIIQNLIEVKQQIMKKEEEDYYIDLVKHNFYKKQEVKILVK